MSSRHNRPTPSPRASEGITPIDRTESEVAISSSNRVFFEANGLLRSVVLNHTGRIHFPGFVSLSNEVEVQMTPVILNMDS